jgi:hypothetical protein
MTRTSKSREHRARELLNLVTLAHRCANLADLGEDERLHWRDVVRATMEELNTLCPGPLPFDAEIGADLR